MTNRSRIVALERDNKAAVSPNEYIQLTLDTVQM